MTWFQTLAQGRDSSHEFWSVIVGRIVERSVSLALIRNGGRQNVDHSRVASGGQLGYYP